MTDFSIEFSESEDITEYFINYKSRLDMNMFFESDLFIKGNKAFFHVKPLIFPIHYIGIIIWVMGSVLSGGMNIYIFLAGLIPFSSVMLRSKYFYYTMLIIGLKKNKVNSKIKLL